jgi:aldehyde dehydrogenase (NAD+)
MNMETVVSYIGGKDVPPSNGLYSEKFDPRTGRLAKKIASSGNAEVTQAVQSAEAARPAWRNMRPSDRGRVLVEVARHIRDNEGRLGDIESAETGKPSADMAALIDLTAQFFEFYGGAINGMDGTTINEGPDYHVYTRRDPYGIVGVILPWNAPLHQAARAIVPALAMGNAVIAKPSEHTPGSLVELARIATEAGLPDGVLNIVVGKGSQIGPAMVAMTPIRKISFTGGLRAGQELGRLAAERVLPLTLELGGKSANIVFADADLDAAAKGSVKAFTWNTGQWCAAGTRLLVEASIHDRFLERLLEDVASLKLGPDDGGLGPITTLAQFEKVQSYFEIARKDGATLAIGGNVAVGPGLDGGWYVEPTVYTGVTSDMVVAREEIFGPVVCVLPFKDEDDAIRIANGLEFGLAAGVWSRDIGRVHRVARKLDAGRIVVNEYGGGFVQTPTGGFKESGYGREQGIEALAEYSQLKSVIIRL